jgi:hypothetical protein
MTVRNVQFRFLLVLLAFVVLLAAAPAAYSQNPCCHITGVNSRTDAVTAKVDASGQLFQFTLNNRAQTSQLKVGQPVYANLKTNQVSLDGTHVVGSVLYGSLGHLVPPNTNNPGIGVLPPNELRNRLRQMTVAPNPADQTGKSALLKFKLEPNGSELPNSFCASLNGAAIDLVDPNRDGNYTGRLQLAERFPYQGAVTFDSNGQQLTTHSASAGGGSHIGGECHMVPCPPDCKSWPTGSPCIVCVTCSVSFGKPVTQSSQGGSKP